MSDDRYRFKIGNFDCIAILDNTFSGTVERLISNVSREELAPHLKAHHIKADIITGSYACLMVNTGDDDWVLIDTGAGDAQEGSQLLKILEDEDIWPDHIIITHAHIDHYGGLINKKGEPTFPNVQVYMCRDEWAIYTSSHYLEENPERAPTIEQYLIPAESQIERVECSGEILPGFSIVELPGHTPHHIGILIESGNEKLIFSGDALVHPLFVEHPEWAFANDTNPETATESRKYLAEIAVKENALVMSYHFEFPCLGRIVETDNGHRWQAVSP